MSDIVCTALFIYLQRLDNSMFIILANKNNGGFVVKSNVCCFLKVGFFNSAHASRPLALFRQLSSVVERESYGITNQAFHFYKVFAAIKTWDLFWVKGCPDTWRLLQESYCNQTVYVQIEQCKEVIRSSISFLEPIFSPHTNLFSTSTYIHSP